VNLDLAYSRPQKSADQLGASAEDTHRFLNKRVLLTGEASVLLQENGRNCCLNSIRLLVRICPNLTIVIPESCHSLLEDSKSISAHISFGKELNFCPEVGEITRYDAILSVGAKVRPDLQWTTINSNGWVARVSSGDKELSAQCDLANPIGALGAACLGVGEVFKRLIRLKAARGELLNGFSFSLRTYQSSDSGFGPPLPQELPGDLLIVGAGAIGNGLIHLVSQLPFTRRITLIDSQKYGIENLGTCILIGPEDLEKPKAVLLTEYLKEAGRDAKAFPISFEQYVRDLDAQPAIVINGLDNIDVRHEVQRYLWPDVVIDGAIGDFTCQVSRHPWPDDIACLICLFRKPEGTRAEEVQSAETGLSYERLENLDALVTQSDVDQAPAENRDFLRSRVGRPICSVVQEAVAHKISEEQQREGFQPSVPFVACFSACMVIAETVAQISGWHSILEPRWQFDSLMGPAYAQELPQTRRPDCICGRRRNIDKLRSMRKKQECCPPAQSLQTSHASPPQTLT
jgi:molybdopterin/thiamine biosynthesis adenylyltransferase